MMVEHAPAFIERYLPQVLQRVKAIISAPNARDEDNAVATDNAVSLLGKILEKFPSKVDAQSLWFVELIVVVLDDVV